MVKANMVIHLYCGSHRLTASLARRNQSRQRQFKRRRRTAKVEPNPARRAKVCATRQAQTMRLEMGDRISQTEPARIDPGKIGGLDARHTQTGQARDSGLQSVAIIGQRLQ